MSKNTHVLLILLKQIIMMSDIRSFATSFGNLEFPQIYLIMNGLNNSGQMKRFLKKHLEDISSCDMVNRDTMLSVIFENDLIEKYVLFIAGVKENPKKNTENMNIEECRNFHKRALESVNAQFFSSITEPIVKSSTISEIPCDKEIPNTDAPPGDSTEQLPLPTPVSEPVSEPVLPLPLPPMRRFLPLPLKFSIINKKRKREIVSVKPLCVPVYMNTEDIDSFDTAEEEEEVFFQPSPILRRSKRVRKEINYKE